MKLLYILVLSLTITGCSLFKTRTEPSIPHSAPVYIDKYLLEPCKLLNTNPSVKSFDDAILQYADLSTLYGECAIKQLSSIKLIKQLGNVP